MEMPINNYKWFDTLNNNWLSVPADFQIVPFFTAKELACPCCKEVRLDPHFKAILPAIRAQFFKERNKGLQVNSCCRCIKHNTEEHGCPTSMHLMYNPKWPNNQGSCAIDFNCAIREGWDTTDTEVLKRIGRDLNCAIGNGANFTHLDVRTYVTPLPRVDFYYPPDPRGKVY
jgi:hypothetical protein